MSGEREIRQLQKAQARARRGGRPQEEAAVCNQLGEALARHGRYHEALEEHRQELRLLESAGDVLGCAVAHRKIGERLAELESYDAALKHQRQHLELARSLANHAEQQRAWATIGRTYMFIADSSQAGEALREAEQAFTRSLAIVDERLEGNAVTGQLACAAGEVPPRERSEMRARLYLNLGLVYDSLKDQGQCSQYIRKSIFISEQSRLFEDLYRAYFNLGNIHLREEQHSKAMRCLEGARECARTMKEKGLESECCASIAQVLLGLGDFVAAKRSLRKAHQLGSQQPQQRESILRSLRYATKASRLQEALEEAATSDPQAALGLCEQLGDLFSKHGDYRRAVEAYERQLRYAKTLQRPEQELAVIHVSLAATFGDLKEHVQAVRHYEAELTLRQGIPLEEGKTWLNIALAKEEAGEAYPALESCLRSALDCAERAGEPRLQRQVLQHLLAVQQKAGSAEAADTLARLEAVAGGSTEEEEEPECSEPLEESDLELSESEGEEDDLDGYSKSVPSRRRINKWNRRNERGETPLHRACIEGDLRRAQLLLGQGHPLNPRDYCGWTPLHEACNHGHVEIVRLLLEHGAAIDDPGGPGCEGITPLHDALSCGHFDVAELLIQSGASVVLRNAKGLNPLDTLKDWVSLYGRDLDQETWMNCRAMERLLRDAMAGRATQPPQSSQDSQLFDPELSEPLTPRSSAPATRPQSGGTSKQPPAPSRVPSEHGGDGPEPRGPQWSWLEHGEEQDTCMTPLRPIKKRQRLLAPRVLEDEQTRTPGFLEQEELEPRVPRSGQAEYQAAIRNLGSAQSLRPRSPEWGLPEPTARPALIPTDQYVGDDWLEDDVGASRRGRKRSRRGLAELRWDSGDSTGPESDSGGPCPPTPPRPRRVRQSRLTRIVERTLLGRSRGGSALGAAHPATPRLTDSSSRANDMGGSGESPPPQPPPPPPIRVRVRVQDNVFLIPVPHSGSESRPVSWLAGQAAERYYQTCGLLPRLTLKKEGALLAPQDLIMDVLQSNEEVLAEVQSWDLPPLLDRYRKACQSLDVGEHPLLVKVLGQQEQGPSLGACGFALRQTQLTPLLRALKLQTPLRQLRLSGNTLDDSVAGELLATLGTLPHLTLLDLSDNQLGAEGLRKLVPEPSGPTAFQSLEELDLSLNPLGNGSTWALASLVQACPLLTTLKLQGCDFTRAFLQPYRSLLATALRAVHLKTLVISHNTLGSAGLELLLQSLPCTTLSHLDVSSVVTKMEEQPVVDPVARYLTQDGCVLTHLSLSGNHLGDEAVAELARCLPLCPSLTSLDLSANPSISITGLRTLLSATGERDRELRYLGLAGCGVRGPLDCTTWSRLSAAVRDLRLCSRLLSRGDQQDVGELWRSPADTSLRTVTRHRKLFCRSLWGGPGPLRAPATELRSHGEAPARTSSTS
ncbi:tonsoku-like protein isoform X2 [Alligator mississippiensis]|uniref:tonsoku-like protein isoform X2 n=1 Tax=Alligator mississippiensis TaxID=8496 RepID=UPI002877FC5B|nr:tonsoku-like protein isoform X2 [Alligator mississippiensis]